METLLALFKDSVWLQIVAIVVTAASAVLMLFPVPKEGSLMWYLRKALEWAAMNFGHGKKATTDKE